MRFILYSEKTVTQCLTAINARMHVKGTGSRPTLDGWVEKSGAFSISMSAPVIGKFARRTVLKAKVERESGLTIIRGSVPNGVSRRGRPIIFVALALVAVIIISRGQCFVRLPADPVRRLSLYSAARRLPQQRRADRRSAEDSQGQAQAAQEDQRRLQIRIGRSRQLVRLPPAPPLAHAAPKTTSSRRLLLRNRRPCRDPPPSLHSLRPANRSASMTSFRAG